MDPSWSGLTSEGSSSVNGAFSSDVEYVEMDPTGRYVRYKDVLGRGAFKTVYRAFDEIDGIEVAWNQIRIDEVQQSCDNIKRLNSEVDLLKSLKHENILKFYASWEDDKKKTLNIITELFTSGSLRQYCRKHKNVDLRAIKNWARQILRGLAYLHNHNPPILHRDIKCDNIFVNGNHGEVKIGDLGLATIMQQPIVRSVIGTPEFMAPELYDEEYNELADVYSFGMCMLEMITREYPYSECKNPAQIFKKVSSGIKPAALAKITDPQISQFIVKCLARASERSSAIELLKDPFLQCNTSCESLHTPTPIQLATDVSNEINLQSSSIDIESDRSLPISICANSRPDISSFQILEFIRFNMGAEFKFKAQQINDNLVFLRMWIIEHNRNCTPRAYGFSEFDFKLDSDTAHNVAVEMEEHLKLPAYHVDFVTEFIDFLIMKLVPGWKPSIHTSSNGALVESEVGDLCHWSALQSNVSPVDDGVDQLSLSQLEVNSYRNMDENMWNTDSISFSNHANIGDKDSQGSAMSLAMTASCKSFSGYATDIDSTNADCDNGKCQEELKAELDAVEAQYQKWFQELSRWHEDAIENARKRWSMKKRDS